MNSNKLYSTTLSILFFSFTLANLPAQDLLTSADLQSYYSASFKITPQPEVQEVVKKDGGGKLSLLMFSSEGEAPITGSLFIRESASPEAARKACEAVRNENAKSGIKIEEAAGIGDYAFWFGRQLNFVKGSHAFILSAPGVKKHRDITEAHAAAAALAEKIMAHLK